MPKTYKVFSLEITPERFLAACSDEELFEIALLLDGEMKSRQTTKAFRKQNQKLQYVPNKP